MRTNGDDRQAATIDGPGGDGVSIGDLTIIDLDQDSIHALLDQLGQTQISAPDGQLNLQRSVARQRARFGVRCFLEVDDGTGYWDVLKLNPNLMISITDVLYRRDHWARSEGERHFKVRLLLSGKLKDAEGNIMIAGPQGHLHLSAPRSSEGYFITGGQETRLVVLHCTQQMLEDTLGLGMEDVPLPLRGLLGDSNAVFSSAFALTPDLVRAVQLIIDSRDTCPSQLRHAFLEAVSMKIICTLLADLWQRSEGSGPQAMLARRDLNRLHEARDYIDEHFVNPPRIPALARIVGINQTKLKSGFKALFGLTIYDYVLKRRMDRAAELLSAKDLSVAEIAYGVGYEYPANFTCAFKRHHGALPSEWRERAGAV